MVKIKTSKTEYELSCGENIVYFNTASGFGISQIDGLSSVTSDIITSSGYGQIGDNIDGVLIQGKTITINGFVIEDNPEFSVYLKRINLLKTILPGDKFKFTIVRYNSSGISNRYFLEGLVKRSPEIPENEMIQNFQFVLYCNDPRWQEEDQDTASGQTITRFREIIPMFGFPMTVGEPFYVAQLINTQTQFAENRGNADTGFVLEITIESIEIAGRPIYIKFHNLSYQSDIILDLTLPTLEVEGRGYFAQAGDVIRFSTLNNDKYIRVDRASGSTLALFNNNANPLAFSMALEPGKNEVFLDVSNAVVNTSISHDLGRYWGI